MNKYRIKPPAGGVVKGEITLNGSKSIANRVLIIRALTQKPFTIDNLSNADDTVVLDTLLRSNESLLDAGAGGTTYRFLTAFLSTQEGRETILTGSKRMQQRPIRVLVDALNQLGAEITYENEVGFPPLCIKGKKLVGGQMTIPASTSSQYITALLLIAPTLAKGLELQLEGEIVSLPYILMTIKLLKYFGIDVSMKEHTILVKPGSYQMKDFFVEADWSAASYYYSMAFLSQEADILLKGLSRASTQGDAVIADIFSPWVESIFEDNTVRLTKRNSNLPKTFQYDFLECPDLAQTVIAALASKSCHANFRGLKTLLIKETDRVEALDQELGKYGVRLLGSVKDNNWQLQSTGFNPKTSPIPEIKTYEDHRMAMALTPIALVTGEMIIQEPEVVTKSYPKFWEDVAALGFEVEEI